MTKKKKAYARAGVDVDLGNRLKAASTDSSGKRTGPKSSAKSAASAASSRSDLSRNTASPSSSAALDGVGTKLKDRLRPRTPRHHRRGPRQPLRQRHRRARRGAALLSRLPRHRKRGAAASSPNHHGLCPRPAPAERLRAHRRGNRADAGLLPEGRIRRQRHIVGVVEKSRRCSTADRSVAGDVVIGLASNGLHTNGYSLARKIFFEQLGLKPGAAWTARTAASARNC